MIKGLVTVSSGNVVNLLVDGELPEVGAYYYLESATHGTSAQNKTFHALTLEYFNSGQSSYDADNYADFKNMIKRHLGAGFEGFIFVEMEQYEYPGYGNKRETGERPIIKDAKKREDIPEHVLNDPAMKTMIRGKLKSWSSYTKKQRKETIDNVISEMLQAGVNTKKFEEIMKGLSDG